MFQRARCYQQFIPILFLGRLLFLATYEMGCTSILCHSTNVRVILDFPAILNTKNFRLARHLLLSYWIILVCIVKILGVPDGATYTSVIRFVFVQTLTRSTDHRHHVYLGHDSHVLLTTTLRARLTSSETAEAIAQIDCDQSCRSVAESNDSGHKY